MAVDEQDERLARLEGLLDELTAITVEDDLVRNQDLGQANFRSGVEIFERTLALFSELKASDLTVFPPNILDAIIKRAEKAVEQFNAVKEFSLAGQQDPVAARDQLVAAFEQEYNAHFSQLEPHINYLLVKQTDFAALESRARAAMENLEESTREMQAKQEAIRQDMEDSLRSVQEAAAKAGVGQQSLVFAEQANFHVGQAKTWLIASAAFGGASLLYAVAAFWLWPVPVDTTAEAVRDSLARLVILTLLLFGLAFSGRQFVASRHNETVNRHRQNALQTFETFVQGAGDPETKDAVLMEATRSIFASQPTGFLRNEGERDSPSTVIEVVRKITSPNADAGG